MKPTLFLAWLAMAGPLPSAQAGERCDVSVTLWQPRETLATKLVSDGWSVTSIRSNDGCYEASARNDKGERVLAEFDPQTLQLVKQVLLTAEPETLPR